MRVSRSAPGFALNFSFFQSGVDENVDRVSLLVVHHWADNSVQKSSDPFHLAPPAIHSLSKSISLLDRWRFES